MTKKDFIDGIEYFYSKINNSLRIISYLVAVFFIATEVADYFRLGYDSTDGKYRSGLGLHVDNMTGCHYLSAKGGGITPRLNPLGHHICNAKTRQYKN